MPVMPAPTTSTSTSVTSFRVNRFSELPVRLPAVPGAHDTERFGYRPHRMTIADRRRPALPVRYAMEFADRARKERYFDPDFFAMEAELLWSRVWQMACRLEEIPAPYDFAEYEILDQSIIVLRSDDMSV